MNETTMKATDIPLQPGSSDGNHMSTNFDLSDEQGIHHDLGSNSNADPTATARDVLGETDVGYSRRSDFLVGTNDPLINDSISAAKASGTFTSGNGPNPFYVKRMLFQEHYYPMGNSDPDFYGMDSMEYHAGSSIGSNMSPKHYDPSLWHSTFSHEMTPQNELSLQNTNEGHQSPSIGPPTPETQYQFGHPVAADNEFYVENTPKDSDPQGDNSGSVVPCRGSSWNHQHHNSNGSTLSSSSNRSSSSLVRTTNDYPQRNSNDLTDSPRPLKPRIATTYWEDEKTICYQVQAHGVLVSRRQDTNFVNGTKLLNLAGMTRGKRDGILKTERIKKVVKIGTMNLKGVWIPFERACEIARNEGLDEVLYPLFVRDLKGFFEQKGFLLKDNEMPSNLDYDE